MRVGRKWGYRAGLVVGLAIVVFVLCLVYSPAYWMTRVARPTITVDDRPVASDAYIGNPTDDEAEAFLLVHVPEVGDYLLNFDGESYREVSGKEFARFGRHAWSYKPMNAGHFNTPLPFRNVNEFRVASHGHLVIVQF